MIFVYHKEASSKTIIVEKETFKHIFTVRRQNTKQDMNKSIFFRNLIDDNLYEYKIQDMQKKQATLLLVNTQNKPQKPQKELHIGWCIIDTKEIEKSLVVLNELGVMKISFMYCHKSQRNYKINISRIQNILISSCQQCGRSDLMQIEEIEDLKSFKHKYPDSVMLNFSDNKINEQQDIKCIIIGAEGGWSTDEEYIYKENTIGINSNNTLKSSSIAIAIASKLLL